MEIRKFLQGELKPSGSDQLRGEELEKVYWWIKNSLLERKRLDEYWQSSLNTLERQAIEIRNLQDEMLKQERKAIASTVQMIAHDLKAPFSMVKLLLNQVQSNTLSSEMIARLSHGVEENIRYVDRLLADLLVGGNSTNTLEMCDLKALFNEIWQRLSSSCDKQYLLTEEYNHTKLLFVDQTKVRRLLANMIGNAMEAMEEEARRIWVRSCDMQKSGKEFVEITIGNEGSYISEEDIEKIFSKYFTYNKKSGSGLGLAICCEIVKSHGGEINCRSDRAFGTEFVFTLPVV